jgi:hypothetical protein
VFLPASSLADVGLVIPGRWRQSLPLRSSLAPAQDLVAHREHNMAFRFLELPPELRFKVQKNFGLDEFYTSLLVCRELRNQGLSSRELLLHQLEKLCSPTILGDCHKSPTKELEKLYRNFARSELRGSNILGDIITHLPSFGSIDTDKTIFRAPDIGISPALALIFDDTPMIHIYDLGDSESTFKAELRPTECPFVGDDGSWRILYVSFLNDGYGGIAILGASLPSDEVESFYGAFKEDTNLVIIQIDVCRRSTAIYKVERNRPGHFLGLLTPSQPMLISKALCFSASNPYSIRSSSVSISPSRTCQNSPANGPCYGSRACRDLLYGRKSFRETSWSHLSCLLKSHRRASAGSRYSMAGEQHAAATQIRTLSRP